MERNSNQSTAFEQGRDGFAEKLSPYFRNKFLKLGLPISLVYISLTDLSATRAWASKFLTTDESLQVQKAENDLVASQLNGASPEAILNIVRDEGEVVSAHELSNILDGIDENGQFTLDGVDYKFIISEKSLADKEGYKNYFLALDSGSDLSLIGIATDKDNLASRNGIIRQASEKLDLPLKKDGHRGDDVTLAASRF